MFFYNEIVFKTFNSINTILFMFRKFLNYNILYGENEIGRTKFSLFEEKEAVNNSGKCFKFYLCIFLID